MSAIIPDVSIHLIGNEIACSPIIAGSLSHVNMTYPEGTFDPSQKWQIIIYTPGKIPLAASDALDVSGDGVAVFDLNTATVAMRDYFACRQSHIARRIPVALWNMTVKTSFATGYIDIIPAPFPQDVIPIPIDASSFPLFSSSIIAGDNITVDVADGRVKISGRMIPPEFFALLSADVKDARRISDIQTAIEVFCLNVANWSKNA